ncbi:hypothetical protein EJB05_47332, partial [Eragrostis curvula]
MVGRPWARRASSSSVCRCSCSIYDLGSYFFNSGILSSIAIDHGAPSSCGDEIFQFQDAHNVFDEILTSIVYSRINFTVPSPCVSDRVDPQEVNRQTDVFVFGIPDGWYICICPASCFPGDLPTTDLIIEAYNQPGEELGLHHAS